MSKDKTMRSLVWTNTFLGLVFLGLSLAIYVFRGAELMPESPPAIAQQITEIQDIEHLRKVALLLVHNGNEMVKDTNEAFVSGFRFLGWLSLICAVFFVANALTAAKAMRAAGGLDSGRL